MPKLVVLKLDGNLVEGVQVRLEIGEEGTHPTMERRGHLPPKPELQAHYHRWQSSYRRLGDDFRIKPISISLGGSCTEQIENCSRLGLELSKHLNNWLSCESFRRIKEKLLTQLTPSDTVRVLIQTDDIWLRRLPWQSWDIFEDYPKAEAALSALEYEYPSELRTGTKRAKVKILAILGNSQGIDIHKDQELLKQLPDAETTFLVEPKRHELSKDLWEDNWDILFFAGHSSSQDDGETGKIYLNQTDSLTIDELNHSLKQAVSKGLQLAIFNSCDGLGLAHQLEEVHIPQIIVMREPVPDQVAQDFLKYFLKAFCCNESLYLAVRQARQRLEEVEIKTPCAAWLPVICQNPASVPPTWEDLLKKPELGTNNPPPKDHQTQLLPWWRNFQIMLLTSLVVTSLVMTVRTLGGLQAWELQAYDQLMRLRPDEKIDPRLLVVEATEEDVNRYGFPLPDATLAQVVEKLQPYQPRVIGLDIFRDRPIGDGHTALASQLQRNHQLIAICSAKEVANPNKPGIKPPPQLPKDRMSFSDVVVDPDGSLRRHLLFMQPYRTDFCSTDHSFSVRVALHYLAVEGIQPQTLPGDRMQLGKTIFTPLEVNTGAYQHLDSRGFQLMLNYRKQVSRRVTITEVLSGQINADWVKDRIVLIGIAAPISADSFLTPYSTLTWPYQKMPGVIVQAQMVSQILSAAKDGRPLVWVWNRWGEALWVWGWSMVGGLIVWQIRRMPYLILAVFAAMGVLYGVCFVLLTQGGWVPLLPSALALLATAGSVLIYTPYQKQQLQEVSGRDEWEKTPPTADSP